MVSASSILKADVLRLNRGFLNGDCRPGSFSKETTHFSATYLASLYRLKEMSDFDFYPCYTNFLTVMMDTKEQVTAAWGTMKEGSTVIYPLQSTFYSSARVVFVDRFGIRWGIMTETAE